MDVSEKKLHRKMAFLTEDEVLIG